MSSRLHNKDAPLCCKFDRLLLLQVNIICFLVALIGITAIIKYPELLGN